MAANGEKHAAPHAISYDRIMAVRRSATASAKRARQGTTNHTIRRETSLRARSFRASIQPNHPTHNAFVPQTAQEQHDGTVDEEDLESDNTVSIGTSRGAQVKQWCGMSQSMPVAGFERLMADVGFNQLDLDILISVATGQPIPTTSMFQASTCASSHTDSYFRHMPSRYGRLICFDDAIKCIASKIKSLLVGTHDPEASLRSVHLCKYYSYAQFLLYHSNVGDGDRLYSRRPPSIYYSITLK